MFKSKDNSKYLTQKGNLEVKWKNDFTKMSVKNIKEMRPTKMIHRHNSQKTPTKKFHRNKTHKNDWQKWDTQNWDSQKSFIWLTKITKGFTEVIHKNYTYKNY